MKRAQGSTLCSFGACVILSAGTLAPHASAGEDLLHSITGLFGRGERSLTLSRSGVPSENDMTLDSMIINLVVRRAVDVFIAIQESVRETHVNRADCVEPFPLFVS